MFGKYLLHEIKNGWRVPVIFAGVCAALTVFATIEVYLMANSEIMYEAPGVVRAFLILFLVAYFLFLGVANLIVLFYIPVRFYKQSYTDIGYMTHSLPVSKASILGAHVLSGALWMLLMGAVDVFAFLLIGSGAGGSEFLSEVAEFFFGMLIREARTFLRVAGTPAVILIVLGVLALAMTPFLTTLQSCCAVSLGQMFRKHRGAGAVLMYFILNFAVSMVNQVLITTGTVLSNAAENYAKPEKMTWYLVVIVAVFLLLEIVECVVFFLISVNRMTKRLNLE